MRERERDKNPNKNGGKKPEIDGLVPTERVPWKIFQERESLCFLALSVRFLSTSPLHLSDDLRKSLQGVDG